MKITVHTGLVIGLFFIYYVHRIEIRTENLTEVYTSNFAGNTSIPHLSCINWLLSQITLQIIEAEIQGETIFLQPTLSFSILRPDNCSGFFHLILTLGFGHT